jgi:hypothetical protein
MYGEGPEELKAYVAEHDMEGLKVLIGNKGLMSLYGIPAFPTTLIIDGNGQLKSRHDGLIQRPDVEKELMDLLGLRRPNSARL